MVSRGIRGTRNTKKLLQEQVVSLASDIQKKTDEVLAAVQTRKELDAAYNEINAKRIAMESTVAELEARATAMQSEYAASVASLQSIKDEQLSVLHEIEILKQAKVALASDVEALSSSVMATQSTLQQQQNKVHETSARINELIAAAADARACLSVLANEVASLTAKKEKLLSDIDASVTAFRLYERRISHLSSETGYALKYNGIDT